MALLSKGIELQYTPSANCFNHTITFLEVEGLEVEIVSDRETQFCYATEIADAEMFGALFKLDGEHINASATKDGNVLVIATSEKTYRVSEIDDDVVTPHSTSVSPRALTNLQEIAEIGNNAPEKVDITVLSDEAKKSMDGLRDTAQDLAFKFLYEKSQFSLLAAIEGSREWAVALPDGTTATFTATPSVKLDGVGVGAALTYTLTLSVESLIVFA